MAIYHCSMKSISRGAGQSIVAAAAYRHACRLEDSRTGEVYDYTRKQGLESSAIYLPSGVNAEWSMDRNQLWNAVEAAEKRVNSRLGRDIVLALPSELSEAQRRELVGEMARHLADRYCVAVDVAIHQPNRLGDQRNHHVHMLMSSRRITPQGFGEKARELDDRERGPAEVENIRVAWANMANRALERAGQHVQIDPRSLKAQGVNRMPSLHLGASVSAMERRGIRTRCGDANRAAQAVNAQAAAIEREIKQLDQIRADLRLKALNEQKEQEKIEQTRKSAEEMRPQLESWAVVAHGLFAGDAGAMFDQTRYPTRQCNSLLKFMRCLNLVDDDKKVQPETIESVFQSGTFWTENAKLFCLMKNEQGNKNVSFSDIYEMPQRVSAFAVKFRAEQERVKKEREEQQAIAQEKQDKQCIQAWKQLANPQYTEDEKQCLACYERLGHYERQNIAAALSNAKEKQSLSMHERERSELTARQCEEMVLHLQNKLDHIGIIGSLFSRSGIERTLADAERKRVDALKQVEEKSKEVEETTKKIRFYLVAQKAPDIIRRRTAEAQERQAKALTPELEASLTRQRQRDEAEKTRMEQEREKAWQLKRQRERENDLGR
jgi:hypothetical protein